MMGDDGGTLLPSCREGGRDVERLFGYWSPNFDALQYKNAVILRG